MKIIDWVKTEILKGIGERAVGLYRHYNEDNIELTLSDETGSYKVTVKVEKI